MQLQIYKLVSDVSAVPLAELRVSGNKFEVSVDNTNGKLFQMTGSDFSRLQKIVNRSSHLKLEQPKEQVPSLLRYLLVNGDVVEITTDGRTALLNGKLLSEEEKQAMFEAVRSGELKVSVKADITKPIQIQSPRRANGYLEKPPVRTMDPDHVSQAVQNKKVKDKMEEHNTSDYDESIESADFDTVDPSFTKTFAYATKHGKFKGQ